MRTDGQTDMTKLIVAFRNFATAPKQIKNSFDYNSHTSSNAMGTERKLFLGIKRPRREAPSLHPVPKLRINGAILPLPHIPSGHAKRQIYCFYKIMLIFLLCLKILQSVRRHSAIVLTVTVNGL